MNYPCFCIKIFNLCSHSWQFKLLVLFITLKINNQSFLHISFQILIHIIHPKHIYIKTANAEPQTI